MISVAKFQAEHMAGGLVGGEGLCQARVGDFRGQQSMAVVAINGLKTRGRDKMGRPDTRAKTRKEDSGLVDSWRYQARDWVGLQLSPPHCLHWPLGLSRVAVRDS